MDRPLAHRRGEQPCCAFGQKNGKRAFLVQVSGVNEVVVAVDLPLVARSVFHGIGVEIPAAGPKNGDGKARDLLRSYQ